MEFLATFGKVVAKNRAFGNNTIFLQQFFQFRRGERSLCSPLAAHMISKSQFNFSEFRGYRFRGGSAGCFKEGLRGVYAYATDLKQKNREISLSNLVEIPETTLKFA